MGRSADYSRQKCAIAASLDIIGEPWTLLIIRDAFRGISRFEQWQENLGLARNVLAARLKHLVANGVFEPRLYCERPRRYEYVLTVKGQELKSLLLHLSDWGQRNVYSEDLPVDLVFHSDCGNAVLPVTYCEHCDQRLRTAEVYLQVNPAARPLGDMPARRFVAEPSVPAVKVEV